MRNVPVLGLHHVAATVLDPQQDVDFWVDTLGLRLVKRTVDFEDPAVYQLYYGDERGTPGALVSTRPVAGRGVAAGHPGAGQAIATTFSVPADSLEFWRARLSRCGVLWAEGRPRFADTCLVLRDSSGLVIELMAADDDREPWAGTIDAGSAIRGLHSVAVVVQYAAPTVDFLVDALGCRRVGEEAGRVRLEVGAGGPGRIIDVLYDHDATAAVDGTGTVHHLSLLVDDVQALGARVADFGVDVAARRDDWYFSSIRFRAPGGVLFEAATATPGLLVDEDLRSLGLELQLPPWLEPERASIVARLPSVAI